MISDEQAKAEAEREEAWWNFEREFDQRVKRAMALAAEHASPTDEALAQSARAAIAEAVRHLLALKERGYDVTMSGPWSNAPGNVKISKRVEL